MRRIAIVTLALALAACGGAGLGAGTPDCTFSMDDVQSVTVLQVQAVPDARWGPCLEELPLGWDYWAQEAKQGEARFWLAASDLGLPFLEVTLTSACAIPPDAQLAVVGQPGVERFVDLQQAPGPLRVVIVPVAGRHAERAQEVAAILQTIPGTRTGIRATVDVGDEDASFRVEEALERVDAVIVIDDREVVDGTVELRRRAAEPTAGLSLDEATDAIEESASEPAYVATWYDRFEGGCITYRFNARGLAATTIAAQAANALGFYPLAELRQAAEDLGFDVAAGAAKAA